MAETRGMSRSQNHDDCSNRKRFKTFDKGGWSDLNHDVLFLVMMQLGFIDFLGFSGVCKLWRSLALSNKKIFIASIPPMIMWIKYRPDKNELYIQDYEGRKLKTLFPYSVGRCCVGLTCGYMILFGLKTHDFWLVNPITRHELKFPCAPSFIADCFQYRVRGVLVFSRSISGWVFVMTNELSDKIWYSIHDTGTWNHLSSTLPIFDLHFFKGKIYTLHRYWRVCVMTLNPHSKLTLLETKNCLKPQICWSQEFASVGEKLYVIEIPFSTDVYRVQELDFGKMKWVLPEEKTLEEYNFFISQPLKSSAVINRATLNPATVNKLELSGAGPWAFYKIHNCVTDNDNDNDIDTAQRTRKGRLFATGDVWYFPHECMNVDFLDG